MDQNNQQTNNPNNPGATWNNEAFYKMRQRRFWGAIIFALIIVVFFGFFRGEDHHSYNDNQNGLNTIAVTGHGEVLATSTIATFSFTASDRQTTVSDAQNNMTAVANKAIDYLKQNGVLAADIQTTDYSVNPTYANSYSPNVICPAGYGNCGGGTATINGYEVSETITVKLRDPSKSGTILGGLGQAGVSNISGLSFTIDNPVALQEQARKLAIDDAKAKAVSLGKDLGIKLSDIVSFDEDGNSPGPIPYVKAISGLAATPESAPTPNIEIGQNKVTSDVTITYQIN